MKIQSLSTLWVVAGLLMCSHAATAQVAPAIHSAIDTIAITFETYQTIGKGGPVMICEVMPTYLKRNRKDNLLLFIQQHAQWPRIGLRMQVEGKVLISFIVGTDGEVYRAKVLKGLHPAFDAEALRVVQLLNGHFSPAICGGVARAHEVVVPVSFFLNSVSR